MIGAFNENNLMIRSSRQCLGFNVEFRIQEMIRARKEKSHADDRGADAFELQLCLMFKVQTFNVVGEQVLFRKY